MTRLFLENGIPAGLLDVCEWLKGMYPEDIFSESETARAAKERCLALGSYECIVLMRELAKALLARVVPNEGGKRRE